VHRLPLSHLQPSLPWFGSVPETTDPNLIKILYHLNSPSSFSWACVNILQVVAQFLITNKTAIYEDLSHIHCCQHLQPPQKTAALHPNHMNLNSKTSQHLMYPLALNTNCPIVEHHPCSWRQERRHSLAILAPDQVPVSSTGCSSFSL